MKRKYDRVFMCGAHGTGKTTQRDYFTNVHPEFHTIEMERRDLHEKGIINLNKRAAPWDEIVIGGNFMLGILSTPSPSISDRSWICKCAYAQALPFDQELLDAYHVVNTYTFPGFTEKDLYVYFPPVIELIDDGVRSPDPEYQNEIDFWVQFYLNFFKISYYTLTEKTVQSRHLEIERLVFGK